MKEVNVYKINYDAIIPFKGTELSACYDICACLHNDYVKIKSGFRKSLKVEKFGTDDAFVRMFPDDIALIPTGMIFLLPRTHHLKFYSRSGNVWKRKLMVANQPAVIDSDYTNESFVLLINNSSDTQIIRTGDAIAQCEICKNIDVEFFTIYDTQYKKMVKSIKDESTRDGGLGHTDKNRKIQHISV